MIKYLFVCWHLKYQLDEFELEKDAKFCLLGTLDRSNPRETWIEERLAGSWEALLDVIGDSSGLSEYRYAGGLDGC